MSMIFTTTIESPLGALFAGAVEQGICMLEFSDPQRLEGQLAEVRRVFNGPLLPGASPHLEQLRTELGEYFAGQRRVFSLALVYPGTDFQRQVWEALLHIPYGDTRSYEQIAQQIGSPKAVRAVGTTNGRNRVAIVIPCHRVVNKDGKLGGYGGGLWRKQWLLDLEQRTVPR